MWELSMVGSSESTEARSIATVETFLLGRSPLVVITITIRIMIIIIMMIITIIVMIMIIMIIMIITIMMMIIRQQWRIEGDDFRCSQQGQPYTTTLKLTGFLS